MGTRTVYIITENGTILPSLLGTGTDIETKFLRGDGTWQTVEGGGGGGAVTSVNGSTGDVTLDFESVGALPSDWLPDVEDVTGLGEALDEKATIVVVDGVVSSGRFVYVNSVDDYPSQVPGGGRAGDSVIVVGG